jgi:glycosyltransferase involved in cell wall biosynthesis
MNKDIFIILPYKESLDQKKSGAVSIYIKDSLKYSIYKKRIKVISSIDFPNSKIFRNRNYINDFCNKYKDKKISIIEIHNRPEYVKILKKFFPKCKIILTYHNDPVNLRGSIMVKERETLIKNCTKIIFISNWIKKRFFMETNTNVRTNYEIIYHGTLKKKNINFKNKQKNILFVGKLNETKGYDIFVDVAKKFSKINPDWKFIALGNEPRKKIFPDKKFVKEIGYKSNLEVLNYYEKSEIAIGNSKWQEPLGRIAIEASSRKCCPIISNVGGLIESKHIGLVLEENNSNNILNILKKLTNNKNLLRKLQNKFYKKNNFDIRDISKSIDNVREQILKNNFIKDINILKILHITNFNERFDGRLHYNTSKRLNNGFVRNGHNVLIMSDRDILYYNKTITDPSGIKRFNNKVLNTFINFKPDLVVLGHADSVTKETLIKMKEHKSTKICQWFLDPLIKTGPDYIKNKKRILSLENYVDASFLTSDPNSLNFKIKNSFFMPNPSDISFEFLDNSINKQKKDLFFAMSHGVHRGTLKKGKYDDRQIILDKLDISLNKIDFDFFGYKNKEPLWADFFLESLKNYDMGLNLSRGKPLKYYSSDRIVQIIANGLLCFINKETKLQNLIPNTCAVYYKDVDDLSNKIKYYKNNVKKMKKIASNGKKFYNSNYNSTIVSQYFIDVIFKLKNKYKYNWKNK